MRYKGRGARKDPETGVRGTKRRSRGDPGKIHRSRGFGVQECQEREEWRNKDSKVS